MKSLKLTVIILCLVLIGITAKESGIKYQAPLPALAQETLPAKTESLPVESGKNQVYQGNPLERGESVFEAWCSGCHTTALVWRSGLRAGEIDSTVSAMLGKDGLALAPALRELMVRFLESRFPRN